jgi:hypothetical protein
MFVRLCVLLVHFIPLKIRNDGCDWPSSGAISTFSGSVAGVMHTPEIDIISQGMRVVHFKSGFLVQETTYARSLRFHNFANLNQQLPRLQLDILYIHTMCTVYQSRESI